MNTTPFLPAKTMCKNSGESFREKGFVTSHKDISISITEERRLTSTDTKAQGEQPCLS